ncbi:MAG: Ig-like domain-containing protein, partial [Thermoplasmata archaeon]
DVTVQEDTRWSYTKHLSDGTHVARIMAQDVAGNTARAIVQVSIDTSAPSLFLFTPKDGSATSERTITVHGVTDEGAFVTVNGLPAPVVKRHFSIQISLEDGPNTITVTASDPNGNSRTVQIRVTLDTQAPLLELTSPADGAFLNQEMVSVTGQTEPSAVVRVNGIPAFVSGTTFEALVSLSEGVNTILVSAKDSAGNSVERTITVYLDTSPPDLTVFTPRDALWTNQSRLLVTGATEQGASVTINGQSTNVVGTLFETYLTLLEGPNTITTVATDAAGNSRVVTRVVYLDTRPPDLVLTSPADGLALASRVVTVAGSVDFGAEVRVNGELVQVVDFVFTQTLAFPEDGTQRIVVSATDQAGNTVVLTRTVSLDTTTPTIVLTFPDEGLKAKQRLITVTGQTEPFARVVINTETVVLVGRDGLFAVPVVLEDGENRITVKSTDAAGNTVTESRVVLKEKPPVVVKEDTSWMLNLAGLMIGSGLALPLVTYIVTASWSQRRKRVLAEIEAAEAERREREAQEARGATMPKVERVMKKRPKEPPKPPEAPPPEAPEPQPAKAGLKDKSGVGEAKPEDIDQATKLAPVAAPEQAGRPEAPAPPAEAGLKDKELEAEGEAGDTLVERNK